MELLLLSGVSTFSSCALRDAAIEESVYLMGVFGELYPCQTPVGSDLPETTNPIINYISLCALAVGARGGISGKLVGPFVGILPVHITPDFMSLLPFSLCPNLRLSGLCIFLSHLKCLFSR